MDVGFVMSSIAQIISKWLRYDISIHFNEYTLPPQLISEDDEETNAVIEIKNETK